MRFAIRMTSSCTRMLPCPQIVHWTSTRSGVGEIGPVALPDGLLGRVILTAMRTRARRGHRRAGRPAHVGLDRMRATRTSRTAEPRAICGRTSRGVTLRSCQIWAHEPQQGDSRHVLRDDDGDVPGWVLITLMTAGLVIVIWGLAGPALSEIFAQRDLEGDRALACDPPRADRDERGSAVAEFVMVGAILTVLTVSVLQLALALHVRNTVLDAASEGARFAALADNAPADGVARCRTLIALAIGGDYARDVTVVDRGSGMGHPGGDGHGAHDAARDRAHRHRGRRGGVGTCASSRRWTDGSPTTRGRRRSSSSAPGCCCSCRSSIWC